MRPCHVGLGLGFVDEHQSVGIQIALPLNPLLPPDQDIGTVLLAGVTGLFFRVSP